MTTSTPTPDPVPQPTEPVAQVTTAPPTSSPAADNAHESFAAFLADWLGHNPIERVFHLGELAKRAEAWVQHVRAAL